MNQPSGQKNNLKFKVIFLGDAGVGKTSIIKNRLEEPFNYKMAPTVGSNFEITEVEINGQTVGLRIWDTAGQEQYQSLMPVYLRGSQVAVIVASIVDHLSIASVEKWVELLNKTEPCKFIIAINKIDLQTNLSIVDEIREDLSDKYQDVVLVSAKTGSGIKNLFYMIAKIALGTCETDTEIETKKGVDIENTDNKQTANLCC